MAEFRPVPGWPGISVSRSGRVRSFSGREIRPVAHVRTGHLKIQVRYGGRGNQNLTLYVHRAVLLAFVGPCPPGQEARHLNGNPADNRVANLAWGTRLEQRADDARNGVVRSKLTAPAARRIRALQGRSHPREVAQRFGVSTSTVYSIWKGTTWAYV